MVLKWKLNEKNQITAINVWEVAVFRYGARILQWKESELKKMTMHGALHPKGGVDRLYVKRKEERRGLISVERFVKEEKDSLGVYVGNSEKKNPSVVLLQLR